MFRARLLSIALIIMTSTPSIAQDAKPTTLKARYAQAFLVGTCVSSALLREGVDDDEPTRRLIATQFNALTPENTMKWGAIHPEPGVFRFEQPDALIAFAGRHGHQVFGHTLVWHNQTPDWVFTDEQGNELGRDALIERMREHITAVAGRYRGKVVAWDVVNEPIRDGGGADNPDLLRDSRWRRIIGDDYLDIAHRIAHEVDPDARLIVNDYSLTNDTKRARFIAVVRGMLDRGVPVHAVGMQGHWNLNAPTPQKLRRMLDELSELGLPIHITELDMNVLRWGNDADPYADGLPEEVGQRQALRYAQWFAIFEEYADRIERVSFWGPHDGQTWLNNWPVRGRTNHPLLFDRQLQPKPAFHAVLDPQAHLDAHESP